MCLLTFFPEGVQPDTDALHNGTFTNDDGHGFAIVAGRRLVVRHGMDAVEMIDTFAKLRRKHPNGPALFHSRFGTGGKRSVGNCHPFRFGGDRRTVVAHNGILPEVVKPDHRCDTRVAADEILPSWFGHLSAKANRDRLAKWIGAGNKLAILTVNPAYDRNAYLINESSGEWADGVWYSNGDYLPWTVDRSAMFMSERCEFCDGYGCAEFGYCVEYELCLDCGDNLDQCQCFDPMPDQRLPWWEDTAPIY